jgi:hypothetical protein
MDSSKIHELWSFIYENYINLIHRFTLKTKPNLALKTQEITMHSGLVKFTIFWPSICFRAPIAIQACITSYAHASQLPHRDISTGLCLPKPRLLTWKIVSCMTEQSFGILLQKKLGKANHFLPFEIKSLLTFMSNNLL